MKAAAVPKSDAGNGPTIAKRERIQSLDIARGAVMVLMAIDHVRVYSGLPAGGPTPGIFFTRWITHFCAPAFVFLAGTGAWLFRERIATRTGSGALSAWLAKRGLWLVLLELTVLRLAWTFNFGYTQTAMAGVIWCIGWSMVALAILANLPTPAIAAVGFLLVAGHNLLDPHVGALCGNIEGKSWSLLARVAYCGGVEQYGDLLVGVLYSLVPWIGVMALGYVFGQIMNLDSARRHRACYMIGFVAIGAFLLLRGFNLYGDPRPWSTQAPAPPLLSFLGTTKYPASLLFLLMTLGPTIALLPVLEKMRGPVARALTVFGRVPFIYYLLHIPLIHALALIVSKIRTGEVSPWLFGNHPMLSGPAPDGYKWSLGLLYVVWLIALVPLYVACRWWGDVKAKSNNALLSYL